MRKLLRIIFIINILVFSFSMNALTQEISVNQNYCKVGDTISISISGIKNTKTLAILSPTKQLTKMEINQDVIISYVIPNDKGFLSVDWNVFRVYFFDTQTKSDTTKIFLNQSEKDLYFTVYIDDVGEQGFINDLQYDWFKRLGGQINIGYQKDDWGFTSLMNVKDKYKNDFIFHHFHAQKYIGPKWAKKVNEIFNYRTFKNNIENSIHFRITEKYIFGFLLVLFLFSLWKRYKDMLKRNDYLFIISIFLIFIWIVIWRANYLFYNDMHHNVKLNDKIWCKQYLFDTKHEFESNGWNYPVITRHGWNVPPKGLNSFYLLELGVLADASFNFPLKEITSNDESKSYGKTLDYVMKNGYEWPTIIKLPLPFYTNLKGELNEPWDGVESNRGLLQIPISNFNYGTRTSISEEEKEIIDKLPNGALVSIWGHPGDSLNNINPLLNYVKDNFKIKYVNADKYLDLFMAFFPRPIYISDENKIYWIYLGEDTFQIIGRCNNLKLSHDSLVVCNGVSPTLVIGKPELTNLLKHFYISDTLNSGHVVYKILK